MRKVQQRLFFANSLTKDHFYPHLYFVCLYQIPHNISQLIDLSVQGVISRLHCPLVNGHRVSLKLTDGATVTYDLYHAIEAHPGTGDFTLCVCPGIGNNSESVYIRSVGCPGAYIWDLAHFCSPVQKHGQNGIIHLL